MPKVGRAHFSSRWSLPALFLALLLSCGDSTINSGSMRGTSAAIYAPGGKQTAVKAMVKVFEANTFHNNPASVCTTNRDGRYTIDSLPPGRYTVWAEWDSFVLFQDSVLVASNRTTLRDDTLECPSSLTVNVGLQPGHDVRTVTIQVAGTGKSFMGIDDKRRATLAGMAGGTYSLLISSSLPGYVPAPGSVTVAPCTGNAIGDTLPMTYIGIPVVSGLRAAVDTLAGTMRLSWDKTRYMHIRDYLIYKDRCSDSGLSETPFQVTTDTFSVDPIQSPNGSDTSDQATSCFTYRVAVRSEMHEIGRACGAAAVSFVPAAYATTSFIHGFRHAALGCDSASRGDTVLLALFAQNATRALRSLIWYDPAGCDTIAVKRAIDLAEKKFTDTLRHVFDSAGVNRLLAIVIDNANAAWIDTIPVRIVKDVPIADAGNDTGVFPGACVRLHGSAYDRFGSVSAWEWKIGSGGWNQTIGPDTACIAPPSEDTLVCSLAVIDDDGNRAVDEMKIVAVTGVKSVAAFDDYSLMLKTDGSLWACGNNDNGQLGDGTEANRCLPVPVTTDVQGMAAGYKHSLIVKTDGNLWACGNNDYGQLGDGTAFRRSTSVLVMADVQSIAAGNYHSLILKRDGRLWACGYNGYGQLGDTTTESRFSPVQVMNGVAGIAAGGYHSLILKSDGTLWACGRNDAGQLGDNTKNDHLSPVRVMSDVQDIAANESHSLILQSDGTLWACGSNGSGRLGDGTFEQRPSPARIAAGVRGIAAGNSHSLFLQSDGTLWACGNNASGQLGDNSTDDRTSPAPVMTGVAGMAGMAAGYRHSLFVRTDGTMWACGRNTSGELGDGAPENRLIPVRVIPPVFSKGNGGE